MNFIEALILVICTLDLSMHIYAIIMVKNEKSHEVAGITSWPKSESVRNKSTKSKIIVNDDLKVWHQENKI